MPTEHGQKLRCFKQSLHEWHIFAIVGEDRARDVTLALRIALLSQRVIGVDARLEVRLYAGSLLESEHGVDGDVDEGERGHIRAVLLAESVALGRKPVDGRLVYPIWLGDLGSVDKLLVVLQQTRICISRRMMQILSFHYTHVTTSAVEKPKEK